MRKRITDKLSFKVFVITFVVQIVFGALICAVIYKATPTAWNESESERITLDFLEFADSLNGTPYEECGYLIDDFILENGCDITMYRGDDIDGELVGILNSRYSIKARNQLQARNDSLPENWLWSSQGAVVTFGNDPQEYLLVCSWYVPTENLTMQALKDSLPLLVVMITAISLVCSFIYTYLFARPVRKLSEVSGRMGQMDFSARCNSKRRDEIGDLGRDLDKLSADLDKTLKSLGSRTEELELEIARVNELERQKDVFFAAASHELKTPVTIAQGQVQGMIDGIEPYNDTDTYLPKTLAALKRMESLINEILTASRMQAGGEINSRRVDLASILKTKLEEAEELFEVRGIHLERHIDEGLFFEGSSDLTAMAVGSLLSNAILYSKEGSSVIVDAHSDGDVITACIRNTDAHIDEKDLPHLFEAFYRTDSSRDRRSGGTGLGLYLAKLIQQRQGGSVSISNDGEDVLAAMTFQKST